MGNALAKRFDVSRDYAATAGHCGLYKIWHGRKKGAPQDSDELSIWTFSRDELAKMKRNPVTDKTVQEQIAQLMRKDLIALKECNIDGIIEITEIIEDSKSAIVFTTERVICSLADILCRFETVPSGSVDAGFFDNGRSVSEMEVSRGLLNLVEGLQYLHTVQRKLHLNIAPESIVITATGVWKFCSLGLSLSFQQGEALRLPSPYFLKSDASEKEKVRLEPDLRYYGPEMTDGGFNPPEIRYLSPATDVFALGVLFYEVYRFNLQATSVHAPIIGVVSNAVNFHRAALDSLGSLDYSYLPMNVQFLVKGMMQFNVTARLATQAIANAQIFTSGTLSVLKSVDTLTARDVGTQCSQLIALPNHLASFPTRVLSGTILPIVCRLCTAHPQVWAHALAVHISIARLIKLDRYRSVAGRAVADGLNQNINEVMLVFLQNVGWLQATFDASFCERHVMALFSNALDLQNTTTQTAALCVLSDEDVRKNLGQSSLVDKLVPKACKEACKNPDANVKIHALFFLSLVCHRLEREYVVRNILPSFKYIVDHEKNPIVSMCIIGNYEKIADTVGPEFIASSILPTIQPLLVDRSLNKQQFALVVNLTRALLQRVVAMRTDEMGVPAVDWTVLPSNQGLDPFQAARTLIAASKHKNALNSFGGAGFTSGSGGGGGGGAGASTSASAGLRGGETGTDDDFFGVDLGSGGSSSQKQSQPAQFSDSGGAGGGGVPSGGSGSGSRSSSGGYGGSYGSKSSGSSSGMGSNSNGNSSNSSSSNSGSSNRIVGMGSEGVSHKGSTAASGIMSALPLSDAAKDGLKDGLKTLSTNVGSIASTTAGNIAGWFNKNSTGSSSSSGNIEGGGGNGSSPSHPSSGVGSSSGTGVGAGSTSIGRDLGGGGSGSGYGAGGIGSGSSSNSNPAPSARAASLGARRDDVAVEDFLSSFGAASDASATKQLASASFPASSSSFISAPKADAARTSSLRKVGASGAIPAIRPPPGQTISPTSSSGNFGAMYTSTAGTLAPAGSGSGSAMNMFADLQPSMQQPIQSIQSQSQSQSHSQFPFPAVQSAPAPALAYPSMQPSNNFYMQPLQPQYQQQPMQTQMGSALGMNMNMGMMGMPSQPLHQQQPVTSTSVLPTPMGLGQAMMPPTTQQKDDPFSFLD